MIWVPLSKAPDYFEYACNSTDSLCTCRYSFVLIGQIGLNIKKNIGPNIEQGNWTEYLKFSPCLKKKQVFGQGQVLSCGDAVFYILERKLYMYLLCN